LESSTEYSIIAKDLERRILSWNAGARRNYGYEPHEILGRSSDVLHDDRDLRTGTVDALHQQALRDGHAEGIFHRRRKDGTTFTASVVITRRVDATGKPVGYLVVSRDVSAEEALRRALEEDRRRLVEADQRKDEFLATLAHELRNPLAPLQMAAQVLRNPAAGQQMKARHLDILDRQVRQLSRLVDDLLDAARISRSKVQLKRERVDLADAVEQGVDVARPLVAEKRHHLHLQLPPHPLHMEADAVRIAQVVGNLVQNAAKYTPPGGRIDVELRQEGQHAVIRVGDNGLGLPKELLDKVFESFVQAHTHQERGGLGLGLTVVRRLVQMHGGTVHADSEGPGRGSTFTVRLPLGDPSPEAAPAGRGTKRVLVVDDVADVADAFADYLGLAGFDVATAYGGAQALSTAATFQPDAVLCDLGMPDLDGYEVARRLRNGADDLLLVAVSGHGQEQDRRRSREAGFDHHFPKPPDMDALVRLLREHAVA
ncbi:MAG TPA: ATP-binding protein, partial [Candidatus Thermoplasmatota archaeon]|nr:ATP-binding protein [Candidatus Thermoplasmatota archaeon]